VQLFDRDRMARALPAHGPLRTRRRRHSCNRSGLPA
jgi:hypothetical protein